LTGRADYPARTAFSRPSARRFSKLANGTGLYSMNGGVTWTATSSFGGARVEVAYDGVSNRTVFFVNDGGVYRASNVHIVSPTSGWQELNNNLGITQFYGAALFFCLAFFCPPFFCPPAERGIKVYLGLSSDSRYCVGETPI
jgi:hypothetical protein